MAQTPQQPEAQRLRQQILDLVRQYHAAAFAPQEFVRGETQVPISGRVFDAEEMVSLTDAALDFWLTAGPFAQQFEKSFARYMDLRRAGQFRLVREPGRAFVSHVTSARRSQASPWR